MLTILASSGPTWWQVVLFIITSLAETAVCVWVWFLFFRRTSAPKQPTATEPPFTPTGKCPVCGEPAQVRFTKGKGMPYESCDGCRVKAVALMCHQRGYTVIRMQ